MIIMTRQIQPGMLHDLPEGGQAYLTLDELSEQWRFQAFNVKKYAPGRV